MCVVGLKPRERRMWKGGDRGHRRSYVYEPMSGFVGVVPLLPYCTAGVLNPRVGVGWNRRLVVFRMARPRTHTRTHTEARFVLVTGNTLKYGNCCTMAAGQVKGLRCGTGT